MADYFLAKETKDMGGGRPTEFDLAINLNAIGYVRFHSAPAGAGQPAVRNAGVYLIGLDTPEFSLKGDEADKLEQALRRRFESAG